MEGDDDALLLVAAAAAAANIDKQRPMMEYCASRLAWGGDEDDPRSRRCRRHEKGEGRQSCQAGEE